MNLIETYEKKIRSLKQEVKDLVKKNERLAKKITFLDKKITFLDKHEEDFKNFLKFELSMIHKLYPHTTIEYKEYPNDFENTTIQIITFSNYRKEDLTLLQNEEEKILSDSLKEEWAEESIRFLYKHEKDYEEIKKEDYLDEGKSILFIRSIAK